MSAKWYTNGKGNNVKVLVCDSYETLSKKAAGILAGIINVKPDAVLGLATGSSPVGTYKELIKLFEAGLLDFSKVRTYNLDEYYPIDPENDQSYHYFMNVNLFDHVNIDKANVHVPDGNAPDMDKACKDYEAMLDEIRKELNFTSLHYHRLDDMVEAIPIEPCKLCTYCWSGKE